MGYAQYPQWAVLIYPFRDRPDVAFPVLFQAVPADRPWVPPTRFTTAWFAALDGWVRLPGDVGTGNPDIGRPMRTDWREWIPAPGAYAVPTLSAIEGTPDQWANGVLWADWQAGAYGPMRDCVHTSGDASFSDVERVDAVVGRSERGDAVFADVDLEDASVWTGGDAPAVLSDVETSDDDTATGGDAPSVYADVDSLDDSPSTGGDAEATLSDVDSLDDIPTTGGDAAAEYADVDSLEADGSVSSNPTPGATCAAAGALPMGSTTTFTIGAMANQWWKFPVVSGTTYRVRYVRLTGDGSQSASFQTGTCSSLSSQGTLGASGCAQWTATYTGDAYVWCTGGFSGSSTYSLTPAAGTCP